MESSENVYLARLREAVAALREIRAERDALLVARDEPIAVIGLACRMPGGADNPEAYFKNLTRGVDAVREIPPERWPASAIPGDRPETRWAALLEHVDGFDAAFFGISPREAESLDPQQRLLLEVAWEAIEDAGQRADALAGTLTGVFIGIYALDYQHRLMARGAGRIDAYATTGNLTSTAAGRIAYTLGLQGPTLAVDTACSSSLVSISLACQSLRAGDSDMAIAGGVNLMLSPFSMAMVAGTQALSPDGRCKVLDARANGFVRGEGCGLVVLKRLSDAQRDGDRIRALIRGWAVNQDGRSTGLTAPNVLSQQDLLRRALAKARVAADAIDYVELHGTGTSLGDPIEADALREVLGAPRDDASTCVLGAVKTNVGHLEAAAGVAGLIKAVLALEHEVIPGNLHFRRLNPRISLGAPFVIPTAPVPWPRGTRRRLAGVSAFGISGTNAHVILEEAPLSPVRPDAAKSCFLLPLSAKSPEALTALARAYTDYLGTTDDVAVPDVVATASTRRAQHEHRLTALGRTRQELAEACASAERGRAPQQEPKLVFVFGGHGSQWVGMGQQLLVEEPVFRAKIEACDALLRSHVSWSLLDELAAPANRSRLGRTEVVQPALFAIQVGLAEILRTWGAHPDAVIGHSVGEVAAAHVAGALSLASAIRIVAWRGRIAQRAEGLGKMAWAAVSPEQAAQVIAGRDSAISIAAVNDPSSTVLSGETRVLEEVVGELVGRGIECRFVNIDYASHCPQMAPLALELAQTLGRVDVNPTTIQLYSTVTGGPLDGTSLDATYWGRNLREPVQFAQAVTSALRHGHQIFTEVGPHAVLAASLSQCFAAQREQAQIVTTLRRQSDERRAMLEALGKLWTQGRAVDLEAAHPTKGRVVSLPAYPWQRKRHWIDVPREWRSAVPETHPLLGDEVVTDSGTRVWEQPLDVRAMPYLADHRVRGEVVIAAATYVEMALAAASKVYGDDAPVVLEGLSFERFMALPGDHDHRARVSLVERAPGCADIEVASRDGGGTWLVHARATARVAAARATVMEPPEEIRARCPAERTGDEHYAQMEARQIGFGPAFRGLKRIWTGTAEALARVELPDAAGDPAPYRIHPALLDACLQVASALLPDHNGTYVPVGIAFVRLCAQPLRRAWARARLAPADDKRAVLIDLALVDDDGRILLNVEGLRLQRLAPQTKTDAFSGCAFAVAWQRLELAASEPRTGTWVLYQDRSGTGTSMTARLRDRGIHCVEVVTGARFARLSTDRWSIDPCRVEDHLRLFSEVGSPLGGVVSFLGLDATPVERSSADTLVTDLRAGCVSTLALVQALTRESRRDTPRISLVTRGAQPVDGDAVSPAQAAIWGLGRTIAVEHPEFSCTCVDLPAAPLEDEAEILAREMVAGSGEDQVALRAEGRLVARLSRGDIEAAEAPPLATDGSYLVVGGLGGLGLTVARWLVERGARHLILMGRSEPSTAAIDAINAMEIAGARVLIERGDVSRSADVARILDGVRDRLPPLRGVVHAAAVLADRPLRTMTEAELLQPLLPKALGVLHLHQATRSADLDFFVIYSSAASLLGSPGQGNYAAANAFVDAFAYVRRSQCLPAMSIQWGRFSDVGLAAALPGGGERLASQGAGSFTPAEGTVLLARLLAHSRPLIGVLRLSVRRWIESHPQLAALPFLSDLRADEALAAVADARGEALVEISNLPVEGRRAALERRVLAAVGRVVQMAPEHIDLDRPFRDHGVDSLMSLEIRNRLEANLHVRLSPALLFTYPTVASLVDHLLTELELDVEPSTTAVLDETVNAPMADALSEQEAEAALVEKLVELEEYWR